MSEVTGTNAQIARALVEAIAEHDRKVLSALLCDDVVWRFSQGTAFPTLMSGKKEIARGFAAWLEQIDGPFGIDELRIHETHDGAIVEVRNHAQMKDGSLYRGEVVVILEISAGRVSEIREYVNTAAVNRVFPPES
jgi:ketosteroid isomerase-like protein